MDEAEPPADHARRTEEPLDLQRVRVRCHVEILGRAADEEVADRAAHDVGVKTRAAQAADHPQGIRIHQARIYPVLLLGVDVSLLLDVSVSRCSVSEKQSVIPIVRTDLRTEYPGEAECQAVAE